MLRAGRARMGAIVDGLVRVILPVARAIAPRLVRRIEVNVAVGAEKAHRPHPYSLWSAIGDLKPARGDTAPTAKPPSPTAPSLQRTTAPEAPFSPSGYVSWPGLADRRYTGRHLPPADDRETRDLPAIEEVFATLYRRPEGGFVPCARSSALFCFFAQWFTDSFLRTDPNDRRRNTSNHEIDFCQIYGLDERTAFALRERIGGRMRLERGLLPRLTNELGSVRREFLDLLHVRNDGVDDDRNVPLGQRLRDNLGTSLPQASGLERWSRMYATGLERGNSTILYTALSTLCVREHNRVADELAGRRPGWDDDRLFETARIVMIRNVLQIVVEDYINHLAGDYDFRLDRDFAERQAWYRSNRISLEFNLLYRWHSLVPDDFRVDGRSYPHEEFRFNNALLERHGVERCVNAASTQPAGRIGLRNTPWFLEKAECSTLDMSRTFRLKPFVHYCERFGMRRPESFAELVGDDDRAASDLERLYGSVDRVELPVGLLAQARGRGEVDAVLPPLVRRMVAVDAFTHIFTNPLLAEQVHDAAFEDEAWDVGELLEGTGGVVGLMRRASEPGTAAVPSFAVRAALPTD